MKENMEKFDEKYRESLRLTLRDFFVILDWSCKKDRDRFNYIINSDGITIGYFEDYSLNNLNLDNFKNLKSEKIKEKIVEFDNFRMEGPVDITDEFIHKIGIPLTSYSGNCFMSISMAKIENDDIKKFIVEDKNVFKSDELIQKFMDECREALNFYIFMNGNIHVFMYSKNIISNDGYIPDFNSDYIYENISFIITDDNRIPVTVGNVDKVFKKEELPLFLIDI